MPPQEDPRDKDTLGDTRKRMAETIENLKKNEKIEEIYNYARTNTKDTIAYVFLVVGLILIFFYPFYGGLLIGIISGLYFSPEVIIAWRSSRRYVDEKGMVKGLVILGTLIGLCIVAPGFFIGAIVAVALRVMLVSSEDRKDIQAAREGKYTTKSEPIPPNQQVAERKGRRDLTEVKENPENWKSPENKPNSGPNKNIPPR